MPLLDFSKIEWKTEWNGVPWCAVNVNPVRLKHYPDRPEQAKKEEKSLEQAKQQPEEAKEQQQQRRVKLTLRPPKHVPVIKEEENEESVEEEEDEMAALRRQFRALAGQVTRIAERKGSPLCV